MILHNINIIYFWLQKFLQNLTKQEERKGANEDTLGEGCFPNPPNPNLMFWGFSMTCFGFPSRNGALGMFLDNCLQNCESFQFLQILHVFLPSTLQRHRYALIKSYEKVYMDFPWPGPTGVWLCYVLTGWVLQTSLSQVMASSPSSPPVGICKCAKNKYLQ